MSTKKRGLFSRKPAVEANPPSPDLSGKGRSQSNSSSFSSTPWPTSPSPPLPSDSQGMFGASSAPPPPSQAPPAGLNGVNGHQRDPSMQQNHRTVSMESKRSVNGVVPEAVAAGSKSSGMRSFFGKTKRSTLPSQPKGLSPTFPNGIPRSQSSGGLSLAQGGTNGVLSPTLSNPNLSPTPSNFTFASASSHPRIRAHHEQQARIAALGPIVANGRSTSPASTPLPFSPTASHFSQSLGPDDGRSHRSTITPGSTPTSRQGPLPSPAPTNLSLGPWSPAMQSIAPPFSPLVPFGTLAPPSSGNTLPNGTVAQPFRIRVFFDHPTTEALYVTVIPGVDTLRTLKHKILKGDNERFVQFRTHRRQPIESKWELHEIPAESTVEGDRTYDFTRRVQLFRTSVEWDVCSKARKSFEKYRIYQPLLATHLSTAILGPEDSFLPLISLFPQTPESVQARLKGLIEVLVRIVPENESVPVVMSFSDMPDQPMILDIERNWTVAKVKEAMSKVRGLAVKIVGGKRATLDNGEFFLFKCGQVRHATDKLPIDVDLMDGLDITTLFNDEEAIFATHPFVVASGLNLPENLLRRVELIAFLIDDMEPDFLSDLRMVSHQKSNLKLGDEYSVRSGVSPAAAIMNNARYPPPSSRGSSNASSSANAQGKRPARSDSHRDPRREGQSSRDPRSSPQPRSNPQPRSSPQRSPKYAELDRSPHGLPSPPFGVGERPSPQQRDEHYQQHRSQNSVSSSASRSQQPRSSSHQHQPSYDREIRQPSPPITPAASIRQAASARNIPKSNGYYTPADFSPSASPRGSPENNTHLDVNGHQSDSSEPGPPSPSSYRTALANADEWISPRVANSVVAHTRSPELDAIEHRPASVGLDDALRKYDGSSAGSLGLSDAGGLDGLKQMLEKARSGSIEEVKSELTRKGSRNGIVFEDVEIILPEKLEQEDQAEEEEEPEIEHEEEERNTVDRSWSKSPGATSLAPLEEEEEPIEIGPLDPKLKARHSRTSSSSSTSSPLLLVHIRKPYAGPITDSTTFNSDDVSPTSMPIPLPIPPRADSNASEYSQSSFTTTPESPSRPFQRPQDAPRDSYDRTENASPASERTVKQDDLSTRNKSNWAASDDEDEDTCTIVSSSPAVVDQRLRFASMPAQEEPPRPRSPTRIKYAHSMAASQRRGSNNRSGSYFVREGVATGYPLRSALKGGKAIARASRPDLGLLAQKRSSVQTVMNKRNSSFSINSRNSIASRNSVSSNTLSPVGRNSYLGFNPARGFLNTAFAPSSSSAASTYSSSSRDAQNSSSSFSTTSSTTTSPRMNGSGSGNSTMAGIRRKPSPSFGSPGSPVLSPPNSEGTDETRSNRDGSLCAEGYAVIGGAMFTVTLRPMDEKGAMVMGTPQFRKAGPMYKLEAYSG